MSRIDVHNTLYLGDRMYGPVGLSPAARARHLYIVGQTGTGKSTLLLNLIAQDLATGRGLALLDPHGDLADAAVGLLPRRRGDDLVWFDPSDLARPIGFNLLARLPEDHRPLVADGVVAAFRAIWPESWGPRLEHIFAHAVRTLMEHGPTGGSLDDVRQTNTVIASHDIVAADSYAATLFELTGEDIAYVKAAADMGLGTMDLKAIKIEELSV